MKIKSVFGRNIKGKDFKHELGPITIITGDNGTGKSAVTDAVRLALLGYHPKLGKMPSAAFELGDGGDMAVKVEFDAGQSISRTWTRAGKTVKADSQLLGMNGSEFPEVLFDAKSFLDQPAKARTALLFEQVSAGYVFDAAMLTAKVKAIQLPGEPDPEVERLLTEYNEAIETLDQERTECEQPLHTWLEKVIAHFKEIESDAASVVKQMKANMQSQAQLQAADGLVPVRQGVEGELATTRTKLEAAIKAQSEASTALGQANRWAESIGRYQAILKANPDCSEMLEKVTATYNELCAKVGAGKPEASRYQAAWSDAQSATFQVQANLSGAKKKLQDMEDSLAKLTAGDCCPSCSGKSKGWQKRCIDKAQPEIQVCRDLIKGIESAKAEADTKFAEIKRIMAEATERDQQLIKDFDRRNELALDVRQLQAQADQFKAATDFLANVPTPDSAGLQAEVTKCETNVNELREKIDSLALDQRKAVAAKADEARREEAKVSLATNTRIQAVAKLVNKIVVEAQTTIIKDTVGAFMLYAGALLNRVMGVTLELKDNDIGYYSKMGKFIGYETFSGAEEYTAFAGLALALASKSASKIVIMDELGRLKGERKTKLLLTVKELVVSGNIDNFIGIDPEGRDWAGQDVQIIAL